MASYSGCRNSPVPHTRIEDEVQMEEVYIIGKKLGEGSFGIVRKVVHKETNSAWACKAVNKEKVWGHILLSYNMYKSENIIELFMFMSKIV